MREYRTRKPGIIKHIIKEGKSIHKKHTPWKFNNPDISHYPKVAQYYDRDSEMNKSIQILGYEKYSPSVQKRLTLASPSNLSSARPELSELTKKIQPALLMKSLEDSASTSSLLSERKR